MGDGQTTPPGVIDLGHGLQMTAAQDALSAALAAAQGAARIATKNARNKHLQNQYADLESVIQAAREAMAGNGLSLAAHPVTVDGWAGVVYVLAHASGQWRRGELLHRTGQSRGLQPAQTDGVCISYARRYVLMSLMQIAAGDDTDGAVQTSDAPPPRREEQRPGQAPAGALKVDTKAPRWRAFQAMCGSRIGRHHGQGAYGVLTAFLAINGRRKPSQGTWDELARLAEWIEGDGAQVVTNWARSSEGVAALGGDT